MIVSKRYNGGFLPDIILFTLCYYNRGTRLRVPYTQYGFFICVCMSLWVFLFSKKMKFFTKGGTHCISQVFPWHFYFMREHSLVELTERDDSAANILVHSMYTYMYGCIHSTY